MRKYSDYIKKYTKRDNPDELTTEEFKNIKWTQYKIEISGNEKIK